MQKDQSLHFLQKAITEHGDPLVEILVVSNILKKCTDILSSLAEEPIDVFLHHVTHIHVDLQTGEYMQLNL